jgi:hypothetical protein
MKGPAFDNESVSAETASLKGSLEAECSALRGMDSSAQYATRSSEVRTRYSRGESEGQLPREGESLGDNGSSVYSDLTASRDDQANPCKRDREGKGQGSERSGENDKGKGKSNVKSKDKGKGNAQERGVTAGAEKRVSGAEQGDIGRYE